MSSFCLNNLFMSVDMKSGQLGRCFINVYNIKEILRDFSELGFNFKRTNEKQPLFLSVITNETEFYGTIVFSSFSIRKVV